MREIIKYGLVLLGVFVLNLQVTLAQEEVKRKSLKELKQIEKGYVEVDEVDPRVILHLSEAEDILFIAYQGTTNLKLSKRLDNQSLTKKYTFNIEKDYSDVTFMALGELKEGSFKISLYKPNNQLFKEVKVMPGQNQNWNQSYCLEENQDENFVGKWTVELSCNNATGYYQFVSRSR